MISNHSRFLLVLLGAFVLMTSRAAAVELVPHEAVYRLSLLEADTKALQDAATRAAIVQSSGALGLRLKRHCGSWQSQSELLFTIELDNGEMVRVHNMLRLRENVGGQRVEFTGWTDSEKTGKVDTRGSATIPASGDPGEVMFDKPKKDQRKLAIGMGLPTESFTKILEQLLIGETPAPVHYFDPYSKYTEMRLLGGAPTILKRPPEGDAELVEGKSWRLRVTPVYETELLNELGAHTIVQVHANGIASHMIIDLGSIKLDATLVKVRRIESSGCAPAPVATVPKAGVPGAEMAQEGISIQEIPNLEAPAEDSPKDTAPPDS